VGAIKTTIESVRLLVSSPAHYATWLKPYTDYELARLPNEGKKRMLVICPAFVSDCLETIEEIRMRGCEQFMAGNGKEFMRIPCLNDHPTWIAALEKIAQTFLNGPISA
jgi:ferrochelatase